MADRHLRRLTAMELASRLRAPECREQLEELTRRWTSDDGSPDAWRGIDQDDAFETFVAKSLNAALVPPGNLLAELPAIVSNALIIAGGASADISIDGVEAVLGPKARALVEGLQT